MRAVLGRNADVEFGVFGHLSLYDEAGKRIGFWHTVEDDWLDNKANQSCVPAGRYLCKRTIFHKHGYATFEITGVPGRDLCLFHVANSEEDVQGCVGLGTRKGSIKVHDEDAPGRPETEKWSVADSKTAFNQFMNLLAGVDEFWVEVLWALPGSWRVA